MQHPDDQMTALPRESLTHHFNKSYSLIWCFDGGAGQTDFNRKSKIKDKVLLKMIAL